MSSAHALRAAVVAGTLAFAAVAQAQFSGSVTAVTDYRYRGVSLSDRGPALQASVNYDHSSGAYGGASIATVQVFGQTHLHAQTLGFAGYARRFDDRSSWDVGGTYSTYDGAGRYDYGELYAGLTVGQVTARAYYSPHYFGQDVSSVYVELNGGRALADRVRLVLHGGILRTWGTLGYAPDHRLFDARVGIQVDAEVANVQLAWVGTSGGAVAYPLSGPRSRNAVVLAVSRPF